MGTKFSRTTKGQKLQVFVGTPINITDDGTYAAFVANAPLGEIGVFDANETTHADAITAAESFFIAQKVTGGIKRTPLYKFSDATCRKKAYLAPVKCKYFLGWNGTGYGLNLAAAPSQGKVYEFAVLETTNANEPLPNFNYNYTAKPGDTEMDVVQALAKQVNDYTSLMYQNAEPLVNAKVKADATYSDYAIGAGGTLTATNGSTALVTAVGTINFVVGDFVSLNPGAAANDSAGDIYKIVANPDANTWILNRPFTGPTTTFTETNIETNDYVQKVATIVKTGLEITALNDDEHFKLAVREELEWADINFSAFTIGNGTSAHVKELESEGQINSGDTAKNSEFATYYGQQDNFATSNGTSETYDQISIDLAPDANLVGPTSAKGRTSIIIAAPKSAGTIDTALATLFGV